MSNFDNIIRDIQNAELKTRAGREKLEARVRAKYKIRDIMLVADFLHGGVFISTTEPSAESLLRKVAKGEKVEIEWTRSNSGIVTRTYEEDRELENLWKRIVQSCHLYIGAASVLEMADARLFGGYAFADEGEGRTLYDYTPDELVRAVPKKYRKQLDLVNAVKNAAHKGAKYAVSRGLIPGVENASYRGAWKALNDEDPIKPKRAPGGGRKQTRDIGDKQVRAVLADMKKSKRESRLAYSQYVIQKGGNYVNPYETAKDLDAAVRRYCKRKGIVPKFSTARTRKWSLTK